MIIVDVLVVHPIIIIIFSVPPQTQKILVIENKHTHKFKNVYVSLFLIMCPIIYNYFLNNDNDDQWDIGTFNLASPSAALLLNLLVFR